MFSDRVVDDHQEKLVKLLDLFVEQVHNKFNKYAFYFFLCELLNIIITVIMVSMMKTASNMQYVILILLFVCLRLEQLISSSITNTLTMASTFTNITGKST